MAWLLTSDWHLNPGERMPHWTKQDYPEVTDIVLNGDLLNILPLGIRQWQTSEGRTTVESIARLTEVARVHFIFGNHEGRLSWVKSLFRDYPKVEFHRNLPIEFNDEKWWVEHGHRFSEWWLLRHIADDIVEWLTTNPLTRRLWYSLCVWRGWLPSKYLNPDVEKYKDTVIDCWALAMRAARKKRVCYIVGHTHTRATLSPPYAWVVDLGARQVVFLPLHASSSDSASS